MHQMVFHMIAVPYFPQVDQFDLAQIFAMFHFTFSLNLQCCNYQKIMFVSYRLPRVHPISYYYSPVHSLNEATCVLKINKLQPTYKMTKFVRLPSSLGMLPESPGLSVKVLEKVAHICQDLYPNIFQGFTLSQV